VKIAGARVPARVEIQKRLDAIRAVGQPFTAIVLFRFNFQYRNSR
jgi:hypothetical protein